jgi:hypothetical protein
VSKKAGNNADLLTGTRPQPDYSVGSKREAFTEDQLDKLSPFIGDFIVGDQSFFMATYYMYFPFLMCEVKCSAAALNVADRQTAHSMTLVVRAIKWTLGSFNFFREKPGLRLAFNKKGSSQLDIGTFSVFGSAYSSEDSFSEAAHAEFKA